MMLPFESQLELLQQLGGLGPFGGVVLDSLEATTDDVLFPSLGGFGFVTNV